MPYVIRVETRDTSDLIEEYVVPSRATAQKECDRRTTATTFAYGHRVGFERLHTPKGSQS